MTITLLPFMSTGSDFMVLLLSSPFLCSPLHSEHLEHVDNPVLRSLSAVNNDIIAVISVFVSTDGFCFPGYRSCFPVSLHVWSFLVGCQTL